MTHHYIQQVRVAHHITAECKHTYTCKWKRQRQRQCVCVREREGEKSKRARERACTHEAGGGGEACARRHIWTLPSYILYFAEESEESEVRVSYECAHLRPLKSLSVASVSNDRAPGAEMLNPDTIMLSGEAWSESSPPALPAKLRLNCASGSCMVAASSAASAASFASLSSCFFCRRVKPRSFFGFLAFLLPCSRSSNRRACCGCVLWR